MVKRVLFWVVFGYGLIVTTLLFEPIRGRLDEVAGPNDAQLVIVSEVPLHSLRVSYGGRVAEARPGVAVNGAPKYALFPSLRTRRFEPVLSVSWVTPEGPRSLTTVMRQTDGRLCLYVLRIDASGSATMPDPPDSLSPYWWTCDFR